MKVALIGDVHANLPALEAVLRDIRKSKVDAVWNTGDFVGYGAFPDEVVKRLRRQKAVSIIGNYDRKVLQVKEKKEEWQKTKHPLKYLAFKWSYDQLSKDSRQYLRSLPEELELEVEGRKVLVVHGSPASIKEHLSSETPERRLKELAALTKADIIICGHSHRPFNRELEGKMFINPGSVGRSEEGDPRACYAVLELKNRFLQVRHFRIEYDIRKAVEGIRKSKLPEEFAEMFIKGRTLNEVIEEQPPEKRFLDPADTAQNKKQLASVFELAKECAYEAEHAHQVTSLAVILFDQLQDLHKLGTRERFLLKCAALLHDIGWIKGQGGHHKTAFKSIMKSALPFKRDEKLMVALAARFHRKSPVDLEQDEYAKLDSRKKRTVLALAALLRVADGLDRGHESNVQSLFAMVSPAEITLSCNVMGSAEWETRAALKKGDLLEKVLKRKLVVVCNQI
jgi:putative phosphoesterase